MWRCYADSGLDAARSHYRNGTCYCSRPTQLERELCLCRNPGSKQCEGAAHDDPPLTAGDCVRDAADSVRLCQSPMLPSISIRTATPYLTPQR